MEGCRRIFGTTFGIGTPNPAPTYAARRASLHPLTTRLSVDDTVRIVACPTVPDYDRSHSFMININNTGCDFLYDRSTSNLVVRLRFQEELGGSDIIAPFCNNFPASHDINLSAGRLLTDFDNKLVYRIISPSDGGGFVVQNVQTNVQTTFSMERVMQLATQVN
jgi:hypothetical protein